MPAGYCDTRLLFLYLKTLFLKTLLLFPHTFYFIKYYEKTHLRFAWCWSCMRKHWWNYRDSLISWDLGYVVLVTLHHKKNYMNGSFARELFANYANLDSLDFIMVLKAWYKKNCPKFRTKNAIFRYCKAWNCKTILISQIRHFKLIKIQRIMQKEIINK